MALSKLTDIRKSLSVEIEDLQVNGITTFTGSVSIGGTLTYEDVTNVDSIGIITARDGLKILAGGANVVGVVTASGINVSSGDITIPDSIIHLGDTNTKIRFPANDTISFETNSAERLRITSTGSVGIGTNNPDVGNTAYPVVQVHSTSTNAYFKLTNTTTGVGSGDGVELSLSGSDAYLTNRESANIIFRTGGSNERLRIDSSGFLGIENTSPNLSLAGARNLVIGSGSGDKGLTIMSGTSGVGHIEFSDGTGSSAEKTAGGIRYYHNSNYMRFNTNGGTERLRIESDGNVRLADTTDNIVHTSHDASRLRLFGGSVESVSNGATLSLNGVSHSAGNYADLSAATGGHIQFRVGTSEKLRIDSAGKIGVGQAPNTKFNVKLGVFAATGDDDASDWGADGIFQLDHSGGNAANNEVLLLGAVSGGVGQIASGIGFGRESTSNWGTYLSFKTHSTGTSNIDELIERVRINSNGQTDFKVGSGEVDIYSTGSGTQYPFRLLNSDASAGNQVGIYFGPANNVAGAYIAGYAYGDFASTANRDAGLRFGVRQNGTFKECVRINDGGFFQATNIQDSYETHTFAADLGHQFNSNQRYKTTLWLRNTNNLSLIHI